MSYPMTVTEIRSAIDSPASDTQLALWSARAQSEIAQYADATVSVADKNYALCELVRVDDEGRPQADRYPILDTLIRVGGGITDGNARQGK